MGLITLNASYKWNHTIFVLLWMTYFIQHVFKVLPGCSLCQNFFPKLNTIPFMDGPCFVQRASHGPMGGFHLLATVHSAATNMGVQISL